MNPDVSSGQEEAIVLAAYRDVAHESPGAEMDARIRQAAHAVNASAAVSSSSSARRVRRWSPLLATAAVAVLAVGVTLHRPDPALEKTPALTPPAPVMQPAVQRSESVRPSNRDMGLSGNAGDHSVVAPVLGSNDASKPQEQAGTASADASSRSAADARRLESPAAAVAAPPETRRRAPAETKPKVEAEPETPIFDEPLPMAVPAPPPAPPPAAAAPADAERRRDEAFGSAESGGMAPPATSSSSADPLKSRQSTAPAAADAGEAGSSAAPESDSAVGATRLRRARAESRHGDSALPTQRQTDDRSTDEAIHAVDAASIARGLVSLEDAVRAVRDAASRGEDARAEALAAAAAEHFGRGELPPDVRVWAP